MRTGMHSYFSWVVEKSGLGAGGIWRVKLGTIKM